MNTLFSTLPTILVGAEGNEPLKGETPAQTRKRFIYEESLSQGKGPNDVLSKLAMTNNGHGYEQNCAIAGLGAKAEKGDQDALHKLITVVNSEKVSANAREFAISNFRKLLPLSILKDIAGRNTDHAVICDALYKLSEKRDPALASIIEKQIDRVLKDPKHRHSVEGLNFIERVLSIGNSYGPLPITVTPQLALALQEEMKLDKGHLDLHRVLGRDQKTIQSLVDIGGDPKNSTQARDAAVEILKKLYENPYQRPDTRIKA